MKKKGIIVRSALPENLGKEDSKSSFCYVTLQKSGLLLVHEIP
jgi:hypothetical protein